MKAQLISHLQSWRSITQSKLQTSLTFSGYLPCCLNASTIGWDCQVRLKSALTKFGSVRAEILPGVFAWVEAAEASHPRLSRSAGRSRWRGLQAIPLSVWLMKEAKKQISEDSIMEEGRCQTFGLWSTRYMTNNRETDTVKAFYRSLVGGGEKLITAATSHTIINVLLCLEKRSLLETLTFSSYSPQNIHHYGEK